jgi:hypothetical protein
VPARWKLEDQTCGTAVASTVLYPDVFVELCGIYVEHADFTVVKFFELKTAMGLGWGKAKFHTVDEGGQKVSVGWLTYQQSPPMLVLFARQVGATDGGIGELQALVIDPGTHSITYVLLRAGHVWGHKEVAIPIGSVDWFDEEGMGIQLKISKQEVQALPESELSL